MQITGFLCPIPLRVHTSSKENTMKNTMVDMFNVRLLVEKALREQGHDIVGAGTTDVGADISVIIDGVEYWLDLRPITPCY
jgi:hypothetical protein